MRITKSSFYDLLLMILFLFFDRTMGSYIFGSIPVISVVYARLSEILAVIMMLIWTYHMFLRYRSFLLGGLPYILSFFALLLFSTLRAHESVYAVGMQAYPTIAICMLTSLECRTKERMKRFFRAISTLFFTLTAINFFLLPISGRLFPEHHYFMGLENQIGYSLNIGLLFCLLDNYYNNHREKYITYLVMYCITILSVFSGSNITGALIILSFLYVMPLRYLLKRFRFSILLLSYTAIFLVVLLFSNSFLAWGPVRYFIENILGKNTTLTNRTIIWTITLSSIMKSPYFGYGMSDTGNRFFIRIESLTRTSQGMYSAHNQILQTLYEGGIIALIPIVLFLVSAGRHLKRLSDDNLTTIFKIFLLATLVMFMAEAPSWYALFFITNLLTVMSQAQFNRKNPRMGGRD